MTVPTKIDENVSSARTAWVKPTVLRMASGNAEFGSSVQTDGGAARS